MTKEKIWKFVKKQNVAYISSVDREGFPNTKAMLAPRKIDGNCMYFSTNTSSMRAQQYSDNPKACVYFAKKGRFIYTGIMFVGTMEVLTDQAIKDEIWRIGDTMYYKKGKTDPDYCVLKFTAQKCRVYQNLKTEWVD